MNLIWNNNIAAFYSRFPKLADSLKEAINFVQKHSDSPLEFVDFWQVTQAKNGEFTAVENGLRLHSSYNPSREAQSFVQSKNFIEKTNILFYGFGLGYHAIEAAREITNKNLEKKLILLEPDVMHFLASLLFVDWTTVFNVKNLIIAVACPQDSVLQLIEDGSKVNLGDSGVSDCCFLDIAAFTNHNQQYFSDVKKLIERNLQKNQINLATLKKFGKLWVRNSLKNLNKMEELENINCFRNKADSLPFLIIGAGPSLKNVVPHLAELKNKMVIVCVETALHTLLRNNIEPDFILLTDPQFWAYNHIAGLSSPSSILITEVCSYPAVFRFNCKKVMLCSSQFPVGQFFEKQLQYFPGDLGSGGSVACSAWSFAVFCGAKDIYFAGLDLGFPEKQTHIKGSSAEQSFHKNSNKITTAEKYGISSLFSGNAKEAKNFLGQKIVTDSRMLLFAWWFESKIAATPECKNYTFCPEGLNIPGVKISDVNEFLKTAKNIQKQKKDFLESKQNLTLNKKAFLELKQNFPNKTDFFIEYPFLKEYF